MSEGMGQPDADGARLRQSATASGGSQILQAAGHIYVDWLGESGPALPVQPPLERLADGPRIRGRQPLLVELTALLDAGGAGHRVRILHGLGGVGKTTAALAVARNAESRGIRTWWIRSTSAAAAT